MKKIVAIAFVAILSTVVFSSELMAEEVRYKVMAGDSLSVIAEKHGVDIDSIRQANNLQNDFIRAGDSLIVSRTDADDPDSDVEVEFYIVKDGDSLQQIALNHKTTVQMIARKNNLSSDMIYPGQKLLIVPGSYETPSRAGAIINADLLLAKAAEHIGTPYRYGGQAPGGFDCSGFVKYIFGQFEKDLPRTAASQAGEGIAVEKSELIAGDLVFFGSASYINHVGIYSGNGQFIHSSSPRSGGVIYSSLSESYYANTYVKARRIIR